MFSTGLYIPYVLDGYTFQVLRDLFAHKYKIGIIRHIDYVYSKHKLTESGKPVRSAFVHFEQWFDNDFVNYLWNQLETVGKYNLANYIAYLDGLRKEKMSDCAACAHSVDLQIASMKTQIDDIPLLIQRPKQTHKEIPTPTPEPARVADDERVIDEIRILLEKHERRIELLEDELRLLAGRK
jgi:hypothetical protein